MESEPKNTLVGIEAGAPDQQYTAAATGEERAEMEVMEFERPGDASKRQSILPLAAVTILLFLTLAWAIIMTVLYAIQNTDRDDVTVFTTTGWPPVSNDCLSELSDIALTSDDFALFSWSALSNYAMFQYPTNATSFVLQPRDEDDVLRALECAARKEIPVAVRCGGHSYAGFSSTPAPGFMIDLSVHMGSVTSTTNGSTLTLGGGTIFKDVYNYLEDNYPDRLAVGGRCPWVGAGGFYTGSGFSVLSREFGLGSDNIVSMRVADPDGSSVREITAADSDEWFSFRGAGWNGIGIVTSFEVETHPAFANYSYGVVTVVTQNSVFNGTHCLCAALGRQTSTMNCVDDDFEYSSWDDDHQVELYQALQALNAGYASSPNWLVIDWDLFPSGVLEFYVWSLRDAEATKAALLPLLPNGTDPAIMDRITTFDTYLEMAQENANTKGYDMRLQNYWLRDAASVFSLTDERIVDLLNVVRVAPQTCWTAAIAMGGEIDAFPSNHSAFPWRSDQFSVQYECTARNATEKAAAEAWYENTVYPSTTTIGKGYAGFPDRYQPNAMENYYGDNLNRLQSYGSASVPQGTFNPLAAGHTQTFG
jgi:hypothetical protein